IANHDLLLDNSATLFANLVSYWRAGYNNDASQSFGLWNGDHGLTSSAAATNAGRISLGYIDGAVQNDPNIGDLGLGLATNRILVRPTLTGDVNLDGAVNGADIGIIIGL